MKAIKNQLPHRRKCENVKVKVGDQTIYLNTGEYEDGTLGEIFVDLDKEGDFKRAMMNCFCIVFSKALQHGVPLEELIDEMLFARFEPAGLVQGHDQIASCSSIVDYIARVLAIKYLDRTDLIQKKGPQC